MFARTGVPILLAVLGWLLPPVTLAQDAGRAGVDTQPEAATAPTQRTLLDRLAALQGERRALIIFAKNRGDERFGRQRLIAQRHVVEFVEHKILVIEAASIAGRGNPLGRDALRERYGVALGTFAVILLGLDGEPLLRSGEPVPVERLVAAISKGGREGG